MCPTPFSVSASAHGGNEGENGAEAGGGDACFEMRKVRRGYMLMMGVGRWSEYSEALLWLVSFHETRRERHIRTLTLPKHEPPIPSSPIKSTQRTMHAPSHPSYSLESQLHMASPCPW